jgi:hypothetical protein
MADGRGDLQFHDLLGQEPERPVRESLGRRTQTQRDHLGLLLTGQHRLVRRLGRPLAAKGDLKAFTDQPLANILDGLPAATVRLRDLLIGPSGTIRVRFEQNLRPSHLLRRPLQFLHNLEQRLSFRGR